MMLKTLAMIAYMLGHSHADVHVQGFVIQSGAFANGGDIAAQYSGAQHKPVTLKWQCIPKGTRALVLLADDEDAAAGKKAHWQIFDGKNLPNQAKITIHANARRHQYAAQHRYFVRLYALDKPLPPKAQLDFKYLQQAMNHHIIRTTQLVGRYES